MKSLLLVAFYRLARLIAADVLTEAISLIRRAETQYPLPGSGADKKAWMVDCLRQERAWAMSYLATLPSAVASAVLDAVVASVKAPV